MNIIGLTEEYKIVYDTLSVRLGLDKSDATLIFTSSDSMTASASGGVYYISCNKKNRFARLLGIISEHLDGDDFEITESAAFETLSCMIDLSFGAPLSVASLKEYFDTLALFGYNQVLMYLEDMYEIPSRCDVAEVEITADCINGKGKSIYKLLRDVAKDAPALPEAE